MIIWHNSVTSHTLGRFMAVKAKQARFKIFDDMINLLQNSEHHLRDELHTICKVWLVMQCHLVEELNQALVFLFYYPKGVVPCFLHFPYDCSAVGLKDCFTLVSFVLHNVGTTDEIVRRVGCYRCRRWTCEVHSNINPCRELCSPSNSPKRVGSIVQI